MSKKLQLFILIGIISLMSGFFFLLMKPERLWRPQYLVKWSRVNNLERVIEAIKIRLYPLVKMHEGQVWIVVDDVSTRERVVLAWPEVRVTLFSAILEKKHEAPQDRDQDSIRIYLKVINEHFFSELSNEIKDKSFCPHVNKEHIDLRINCFINHLIWLNRSKILKNDKNGYGFLLAQVSPSEYLWIIDRVVF